MEKFDITEAKTEYIKNIKNYMTETGSMFPHISVFGIEKTNQKKAIIHIPIPAEYMKSNNMKDEFVDKIIPAIAKEVNKKFIALAVGWASEAWMGILDKSGKPDSKTRKEVLFIIIESETGEYTSVYEIQRLGKQVNQDGELTDIIELSENSDLDTAGSTAGRFSGLYKRFIKEAAN